MAVLHDLAVTQSNSETDDSTAIRISRFSIAGSNGTSVTPRPTSVGHAASGLTVRAFDTTDASGTETILWEEGISTLAGFVKIWTPETRILIPPSGRLVVKFMDDVNSIQMHVSATVEELD